MKKWSTEKYIEVKGALRTRDLQALLKLRGVDVSLRTMYEWEKGNDPVRVEYISAIADVFKVPIQDFFVDEDSTRCACGSITG